MRMNATKLYLDIPDLPEHAFKHYGDRKIKPQGDDGGGQQQSSTQTQDLPDWAKPYAKEVLGVGSSLGFTRDKDSGQITGFQPYQQYQGERQAQFSPLQQQSFQGAGSMQPSAATGQGINIAGQAAQKALDTTYQTGQFQNQFQAPGDYNQTQFQNPFQAPQQYSNGQFNAQQVQGPKLEQYRMDQAQQVQGPQLNQYAMGPAERVNTQSFAQPDAAEAYMSPYMQSVVGTQQREAKRASEIQRNQDQAQAVSKGAFGGSRQAIVEAERQRNLGTQLGDIQAAGSQAAYQQAQQQFNQEQAARLQAQQANQQAGLTVGQQNLASQLGTQQLGAQTGLQAALANQQAGLTTGQQNLAAQLGTQQLGAQTGMQAALANQQYGLNAQQLAEQSRQFGAGQGMTAAQLQAQYGMSAQQAQAAENQFAAQQRMTSAQNAAQYGQAANQLAEQSRQYGAGLGIQGLQTAMTGAGQLGALGGQQFTQGMDINKLQNLYGTQQQQQVQTGLNQKYEDYLAEKKNPYQQVEFMSNLLRGTPSGSTQTMYTPTPSTGSQVLGAGTSLAGAYLMGGRANGGMVSSHAKGGRVSDAKVKRETKRSSLVDLALSKMA